MNTNGCAVPPDHEQLELDGMPPRLEPEPIEPMPINGDIKIRLSFRGDLAGLVAHNRAHPTGATSPGDQPVDYDELTDDVLARHGYQPWERGVVFVYNFLEYMLDANCDVPDDAGGWLVQSWDDELEIDTRPRWTVDQQLELDDRLVNRYSEPA